jgi:hypothetical protein
MAAQPKITPEQWTQARQRWEGDPRPGYVWIVQELGLPVSKAAVRKVALRDGWTKGNHSVEPNEMVAAAHLPDAGEMVAEIPETIAETLPETKVAGNHDKPPAPSPVKRGGRPSGFKPDICERAYKLCLLGATDAVLALAFEVSESTINNWKQAHPVFMEALKKGKLEADGEVACALYRAAVGGHTITDTRRQTDSDGKVTTVEETRQVPPSATAMIFWLKNRQAEYWRDKVEAAADVTVSVIPREEIHRIIAERMAAARARQAAVYAERGIVIDADEVA